MNLQVVNALGIKGKIFALGTAQGGWIAMRMALLAPDIISGVIPLGTSMDYESERTRLLGCWDAPAILTPFIEKWTSRAPTPAFRPGAEYTDILISQGFGELPQAERDFWTREVEKNYRGDEGRQRIRVAMINLRDRDGLQPRLFDVRCPVLWMQGTEDKSYSVANAEEEIRLFANSKEAKLRVVEGGQHFLSWSNPREVNQELLEFVRRWS
ncbi:Hypothetical protein D9617_13g098610 [Elsinoe fawcettii]|nr:Hypothetical protein D9617_13g098610 [Elsinoe fawcettii]